MLTYEPDYAYSSQQCGYCSISCQVLMPQLDDDGRQVYNDQWQPMLYNDTAAVGAEMEQHMADAHPEVGSDNPDPS